MPNHVPPEDVTTPYPIEPPYQGGPLMGGGGYGHSPGMDVFNADSGRYPPYGFPQSGHSGLQSPDGPSGMPEQCMNVFIHVHYFVITCILYNGLFILHRCVCTYTCMCMCV